MSAPFKDITVDAGLTLIRLAYGSCGHQPARGALATLYMAGYAIRIGGKTRITPDGMDWLTAHGDALVAAHGDQFYTILWDKLKGVTY